MFRMILVFKILVLMFCALAFAGSVSAQDAAPDGAQDSGSVPVSTQYDPAYLALTTSDVYVEPGINGIDVQALQQAASQSQDHPHTPVKIAILSTLPPAYVAGLTQAMAQSQSLERKVGGHLRDYYTFQLHKSLNLDKSPLVLVVLRNPNPGVSVWTTALDASARTALEKKYAPAIAVNPQSGTAQLAEATAAEINSAEYKRGPLVLWIVFLAVAAGVAALIVSAGRRKKKQMAELLEPIKTQRENTLQWIEYLDGYIGVLPKNNPDSDSARTLRQAASAKYESAAKIIDRATEVSDLRRAQALLTQSQADTQEAKKAIDRANGGVLPGDEAMRPSLPETQAAVDAIPPKQRGVSFFSGRPAPLGSLVPVTITLNGQSRQVLVTPDEADALRRGEMPQVLAFQQGGRSLPWYAYDGYDPYREYWRYENAGWGGYGGGWTAGYFEAALLTDLLLTPTYGMGGYAPYAFATDMPGYQPGYADPGFGSGGDFGGGGDFAGAGGDSSGGYDTQGFDPGDAGAGDFFGGGFDSGGGGDFGGGDGGGGDGGGGDGG